MAAGSGGAIEILRGLTGAAGWTAVTRQGIRHELHLSGDQVVMKRRGMLGSGRITLFQSHGGLLGRSSFEISPGSQSRFRTQAEAALLRAGMGGEPPYPIPGQDAYTGVPLLDPEITRKEAFLLQRARFDMQEGLKPTPEVRLGGAEISISLSRTSVATSAGAAAENDESEILVAMTLVASRGGRQQERRVLIRRRRYEDLDLKARTSSEAQWALDRLEAAPPAATTLPVLLGPAVLGDLVGFLVEATDGERVYHQGSPFRVGESILPGEPWPGDPLVLNLNALFPFGPDSYRIDETGVAARNVRVIDKGVFVTPHADSRHAAWLKLARATGRPGTPQLSAGPTAEADLRSGDHLELIQLQEFRQDVRSGRFRGEIILGYEVRGGARHPVAGGIVSGSVARLLSRARYATGMALLDRYAGPVAARVEEGLTVAQ